MDAKTTSLALAPIFLGLFLLFASQIEATLPFKALVGDTCKSYDDTKFCTTTLLSDPKILTAGNIDAVAKVGLGIAQMKTVATQNIFNDLCQQPATSDAWKPALRTCANSFKEAATFFDARVIGSGTASLDVHYALDKCESCEKVLSDAKINLGPALDAVAEWKKIFNVSYATVMSYEAVSGPEY